MNSLDNEGEISRSQEVKESDRVWTTGKSDKNPLPNEFREGGSEVAGETFQVHAS
jgi:hypothetical protein